MTDIVYFTEDLVYDTLKKKFFTSETICINHRNWISHFENYGYCLLDEVWKPRLGKNYSKIGIMECGSEGDCLFYSISEALNFENMKSLSNTDVYTADTLREIAAEQISEVNFPLIIESYRLEAESFDFNGDWDPYMINNIEIDPQYSDYNLRNACGATYWPNPNAKSTDEDYDVNEVMVVAEIVPLSTLSPEI